MCVVFSFALIWDMAKAFDYSHKDKSLRFRAVIGEMVKKFCPPEAVLVSDVPAIIAWRTNRLAFFVPETRDHLEKIDEHHPIDYVLITLGEWIQPDEKEWIELYEQPKDYSDLKLVSIAQDPETNVRYGVLYRYSRSSR